MGTPTIFMPFIILRITTDVLTIASKMDEIY